MSSWLSKLGLRSLRVQVLFWTILPLTILLIVFSLTGIGTHQASMRQLAADENTRLVTVMANGVATLAREESVTEPQLAAILQLGDSTHASQVLLVDGNGQILYQGGAMEMPAPGPASPHRGEFGAAGVYYERVEGEEIIVAFAPVPGTDWMVILREPLMLVAEPLIRFEQAMPFVLLIATSISLLTLFFGLRYIVRPLRLLAERAHQVGEGDFTTMNAAVGGVDEIEALRLAMEHMTKQIRSYQAGLETYLHAVTRAQEEERARLARELHDETVQALIALDHKLQMVLRSLDRDPSRARDQIAELRHMVADATAEVRRFSQALRPIYLEDLGLVPALELLASEAGAGFTLLGEPRRLSADVELAFYRIAQESLNNARRHAQANEIEVTLAFQPALTRLTICDDGVGFDPSLSPASLTRSGHFGLMGIRERASLAGATLQIDTAPGQGVTVVATVPC